MYVYENTVIDGAIFTEAFACNLAACKGACCVEGEGGAPLTAEEAARLEDIQPQLAPFLLPEGKAAIEEQGAAVFVDGEHETPLVGTEGPCAYVTYSDNGTALCGIEQAYRAGAVTFHKPISCHLYPIRIEPKGPFEYMYYHRWHICSPACSHGAQHGIPVFRFVKEALIRRYGEGFYSALEALYAAQQANAEPPTDAPA